MIAICRLRCSSSSRTACGEPVAHRGDAVRAARPAARARRSGCRPRPGRSSAPRRGRTARRRALEAADVEVVDHLVDRSLTSSTNTVSGSTSPTSRARRAPPGRTRASSRSWPRRSWRSRATSRSRRCSTSLRGAGRRAAGRSRRRPGRARRRASARAAPRTSTSRSRTRSRSSPVAIRVNVTSSISLERHALGDVARGERGDRVRLAGAGARLEHGDAGRQRPAEVELGG